MTDMAVGQLLYTPQDISNQLIADINTSASQQADLEEEISSGSTVNKPSDNPALAAQLLKLQATNTRAQTYVSNANDGVGWLQQGTSTVNEILQSLQTIESSVESASGEALTGQAAATQAIAAQVASGIQQLLGLANTTYDGQAIFAGTGSSAYDSNGNYIGGSQAPTRTVASGVTVPVAVIGTDVFGPDSASGLLYGAGQTSGTVGVLQQIVNDLNSGNVSAATTTDLANLQTAMKTVEAASGQLGASYQSMQTFSSEATATQQAIQTEYTNAAATNLPQAMTNLTAAQNDFQSALWATAQVSHTSLVQFLS